MLYPSVPPLAVTSVVTSALLVNASSVGVLGFVTKLNLPVSEELSDGKTRL